MLYYKMSLNWTREATEDRGTFGEVGFENPITYVVSTPDSGGVGAVVSLNSDKVGLLLRTNAVPEGVQRNNGSDGIELYTVNYVFEAIPDANGEASFTVDGGSSISYLAATKVTTVFGQKFTISGTETVQCPNNGAIFKIRARHSSGCDYDVKRWNIIACKVGNRLG